MEGGVTGERAGFRVQGSEFRVQGLGFWVVGNPGSDALRRLVSGDLFNRNARHPVKQRISGE